MWNFSPRSDGHRKSKPLFFFLSDSASPLLPTSSGAVDPSDFDFPVFLEEPQDAYASKGAPAVLRCHVAHALKAYFACDRQHVKADKEEEVVDPHNGVRYTALTLKVRLKHLDHGIGSYSCQCSAASSKGEVHSREATVREACESYVVKERRIIFPSCSLSPNNISERIDDGSSTFLSSPPLPPPPPPPPFLLFLPYTCHDRQTHTQSFRVLKAPPVSNCVSPPPPPQFQSSELTPPPPPHRCVYGETSIPPPFFFPNFFLPTPYLRVRAANMSCVCVCVCRKGRRVFLFVRALQEGWKRGEMKSGETFHFAKGRGKKVRKVSFLCFQLQGLEKFGDLH